MNIDSRYWAGLFDGEGSIYFDKRCSSIQITVTQKDTPILHLLKNRFGGAVTKYGKQNCHKWRIVGVGKTLAFLKEIGPFCIIKAVEVQCALEMLSGWKFESKGYHPLSDKERERRVSLRHQLMTDRKTVKII